MKNVINYYYNFDIINLRKYNNNFIFEFNNKTYLFYYVEEDTDINYALKIYNTFKNNILLHEFIPNRDKKMITFSGTGNYILLKLNIKYNSIISFDNINEFLIRTNIDNYLKDLNKFDWVNMWSRKIDFLEYYMNEKDNVKDEIKIIFNYFIGIGENAINYIKKAYELDSDFRNNKYLRLCHRRLNLDYTSIDLFNPFNLIVDHESRDIAEYLKSLFINAEYDYNKICEIIKKTTLSKSGYMFLLGRVMFPTFFFDNMPKDDFNSNDILKLYDYTISYERFINMIYNCIKKTKNINIPSIIWLNI